MAEYLFHSDRLGFRAWDKSSDLDTLAAINASKEVMEFFPSTQDKAQTKRFIEKQKAKFIEMGYCFFNVDEMQTGNCIGFIGITDVSFESDFTPAVEIGWRLDHQTWGKGYATEGAQRCLEWAKEHGILEIVSFTALQNQRSEKVMKKIGMEHIGFFKHPLLPNDNWLSQHTLYKIKL